jgi:hypothetical protein
MSRLSLKNFRTQVKAATPGGNSNDVWSPMGDMQIGQTAKVRLVPGIDPISQGFWTIQKSIKLKFVSPEDDSKEWTVTVPCLEMYEPADSGVKCPVANEARKLFDEAKALKDAGTDKDAAEALNKIALDYWIKYSYLFQGFMLEGGRDGFDPNVNIAMRFPKSMFSLIHTSVMDANSGFDTLPTGEYQMDDIHGLLSGTITEGMTEEDFMSLFVGRNYIVKVIKKGEHRNYETSTWDMKESTLADEQIDHLAKEGFIDLRKYLPKRPSDEMYEVYADMARISIAFARGEGDGAWNPEWEELGIKPNKGKDTEGGDDEKGGSSGGSLKSNLASRLKSGNATPASAGPDGVRSKLLAARGAAASKPKDDAVSDPASSSEVTETTTATEHPAEAAKPSQITSLADRLKAKKAAAQATA